ncbi:glycerophosphodiester phosphodiesterase family protein [Cognatishimia maritima]|uniref:Glycerophosphoryl diester phosphodiesterase n=1 Tax=Cognatishimia maritima TaxID=870908 RepID=A0A1M5NLS6_9RHOB|nr:glycerophosphodiester phosphodiesterase family protein [Cognatishimia maritima]SHG90458.1 Glycerophosphoryl diester phosphodiesterase [Cognatishimia maritima]
MTALDPRFLATPIAHRALHNVTDGRPENSRAAIQAAIDAGYGIEIDLQLSSDGVPMVFHDYRLNRLAHSKGDVVDRTAKELSAITLKGGDEGIPNLAEVLALVAAQVPLLIEFKDQDRGMGPAIGPLEEGASRLLNSYQGPLALMSFNPHSVARLAQLCPEIPRGLVTSAYDPDVWSPLPATTCDQLRDIPDYDRVGACFISHEAEDLQRPRVADLKAQGAHILCWTVTSAAMEAEARKIAENITFEQYLAAHPA